MHLCGPPIGRVPVEICLFVGRRSESHAKREEKPDILFKILYRFRSQRVITFMEGISMLVTFEKSTGSVTVLPNTTPQY
jgi:hypothetical protein